MMMIDLFINSFRGLFIKKIRIKMTHYDSNGMQFMLFATTYRVLPCGDFVYLQYDSNCTVHNTCYYLYLQFLPCVHSALASTTGRVLKVTTLCAVLAILEF